MENSNDFKKLCHSIYIRLGGSSIEVELNDDDYAVAFDTAVRTYRTHSTNAIKRGWYTIQGRPGEHSYKLPVEIDNVIELRRFRAGFFASPGASFEPFAAAFIQQTLRGAGDSNTFPGLVQFEALSQYTELLERMFAANLLFEFSEGSSELYIWQTLRAEEPIGVHCSALKNIDEQLKGSASYRWLQSMTMAELMIMLGRKYGKAATMPGPQGGITLSGDQLKAEGAETRAALIESLLDYSDGGHSAMPIFG